MKFKYNSFFTAWFLLCAACVTAQKEIPLTIGDKIPDLTIDHVVNYKATQVRLADFKGKLLILDFWATWCAPCISMLPVCDSLQEEFDDSIQIVPVTEQDKATVSAFINNMQHAKHISVFSVTSDTILQKLFPHVEIPHYVWIDKTGKVIAITGADNINKTTISAYFKTGKINAATKADHFKQIDEKQPMFRIANELIEGNATSMDVIPADNLFYHSVLTGYIEGFGCESGQDSTRMLSKNNSLGGLYRDALSGNDIKKLLCSGTVWKITNPSALAFTDSAEIADESRAAPVSWLRGHTFCYELEVPPSLATQKPALMLQDLNKYFGAVFKIEGGLEKTKTKVLALTKTGKKDLYATKGITEKSGFNKFFLKLSNQPMYALINFLSVQMDLLPPLTDETGYTGNIDIELNCDLSDPGEVNKALAAYGLELKEKEEVREMIVIKDKQ